jgi:predicted lipoprotein with Yx(FWY)xxD motif
LTTANKAPFGTYLVDGSGRALYVLEGTQGQDPSYRCNGMCLQHWPPMAVNGPPVAASGVDPAKLGTTPGYGGGQTSYAGWPLYYYFMDRAPGDTTGQDVHDQWGVWHLLSPSGVPIRPAGGY